MKLIPVKNIMNKPFDTDWLIKDYLPANSTVMVFGPPASGKSLIAIEKAYCVGNGIDYHGHQVKKGTVVYVAGEGFSGIGKRLKALEIHNNNQAPNNIFISETSMDLNSSTSTQDLIKEIERITDHDVNLIIIDTLHRNFTGDENNSKDISVVMKHCDRLRLATGATIILVHHSGLNDKGRGRGSSSIKGAMDVEYKVSKLSKSIVMHNTKVKDIEEPSDINFSLEIVNIGKLANGDQISAPILTTLNHTKNTPPCTGKNLIIFNHLIDALDKNGVPISSNDKFHDGNKSLVPFKANQKMIHKDDLYKLCSKDIAIKSLNVDVAIQESSKRKSFARTIKDLVTKGFIASNDDSYYTIPASTEKEEE